jgi:hypothetical protein
MEQIKEIEPGKQHESSMKRRVSLFVLQVLKIFKQLSKLLQLLVAGLVKQHVSLRVNYLTWPARLQQISDLSAPLCSAHPAAGQIVANDA